MNLDDLSLEELYALKESKNKKLGVHPVNNTPKNKLDDLSLDELYALKSSREKNLEDSIKTEDRSERGRFGIIKGHPGSLKDTFGSMVEKGAHLGKLGAQSVGRAATNLPNIPQGLYNLGALAGNLAGANLKGFSEEEMPGYHIQKGLKHIGIDLNSEKPANRGERLFESLVEGASGAAMGGGLGTASKGVPYLGKAAGALLGAPETAGQVGALAGTGGAISGALQTLQDAGIDTSPLVLGMAALPVGRAAYAGIKGISKIPGKINDLRPSKVGQSDAARNLQTIIGKEEVPGVIAGIERGQAKPSSFGYDPTTAELAQNPGLSMLQETYRGSTKHPELAQGISERTNANIQAKNNKLTEFQPEGSAGATAAQEHLSDFAKMKDNSGFEKTTTPSDAGSSIRKGLKDEIRTRKGKRREEVGDKYSTIENMTDRLNPTGTHEFLKSEIDKLAKNSDLRKPIKYLQGILEGDSARIGNHPINPLHPEVKKLSAARTDIESKLKVAKRAGDENLVRIYSGAKKALDKDLSSHPEIESAWKKYAEASKPVNEISLHPTFKKIIKSSDYDAHDLIPDSAVPKKIINASEASENIAADFKKIIGDNKEVMGPVKGYINNKIIKEVVDKNGNPSLAKIHKFKEKYPGSFTLYDHLDTKLKNMSNATKFLSDIADKNYKETTRIYDNMFKSVVGSKPEKMVQSLFQGGDSTKKIDMYTKILKTDKTGQAWEGGRRAVMDYISEQAESPAKFTKFYKGNLENLKRIVGPDEMRFLAELNDRYTDVSQVVKQSQTTNSSTIARDMTRKNVDRLVDKGLGRTILDESINSTTGIITGHLSKVPGGKLLGAATGGAYKWYNNAISSSMQKNIHRALLEPSYMKMMLEDITTKQGKEAAKKFMGEWNKQRLSGYAIGQHASDMGEDDKR